MTGALPSIVVLGVGNTLMRDDGIGVWAVRALAEAYDLPDRVRLIDGGVAGLRCLPEFEGAGHLLIIDAVSGEKPPGTIYYLTPEDLSARPGPYFSAHEVGVAELLSVARFLGRLPLTRILGVQPQEVRKVGLDLTPALQTSLPRVVDAAVGELESLGVKPVRKVDAHA
ncbi:MAG TPA: HyaD/HybD family hydrogenase maturation endopeptidase [Nitrospiria bacterium]|nr:HyaD/HybD family hydrogenase maturation endopeptidase [Nitrospiria bacterium]